MLKLLKHLCSLILLLMLATVGIELYASNPTVDDFANWAVSGSIESPASPLDRLNTLMVKAGTTSDDYWLWSVFHYGGEDYVGLAGDVFFSKQGLRQDLRDQIAQSQAQADQTDTELTLEPAS